MNVNFYLKDKHASGETLVYLFFRYKGKLLKYSTGLKVAPAKWNERKQRAKPSRIASPEFNAYLDKLQTVILEVYQAQLNAGPIPQPAQLRAALDERFRQTQASEKENAQNVLSAYEDFLAWKAHWQTARTVQKYQALFNHLKTFHQTRQHVLSWASFDLGFYEAFVDYLRNDQGFLNNTVGKYIANLKAFLNWAADNGYHDNYTYQKFKTFSEDTDIVYLTEEELQWLEALDLRQHPRLANVRQLFLLACATGQRYSDVATLRPEDLRDGFWHLRTVKTREPLRIPLSSRAKRLIETLPEGGLKVISNQKMNQYLKELCRLAGLETSIRTLSYRGVERIERLAPKWQLITTHTARRTFVTLSLEKGMRPEVLMRITGHKDFKTLKKYIKLTDQVVQREMAAIWD